MTTSISSEAFVNRIKNKKRDNKENINHKWTLMFFVCLTFPCSYISAYCSLTDRPTYKLFIEKILLYGRIVHRKNQSSIWMWGREISFLYFYISAFSLTDGLSGEGNSKGIVTRLSDIVMQDLKLIGQF